MNKKQISSFALQKKAFLKQMAAVDKKKRTKMFLVMVANTLDPSIGKGCAMDVNTVRTLLGDMADQMEFNLFELIITGRNYKTGNVQQALDMLNPGTDDIVIFYYTGHGFSFEKELQTRPPQLDLQSFPATNKIAAIEKTTKNLHDILDMVKSRGARMNIVIGDCCNDKINFNRKFTCKVPKKPLLKQPRAAFNKATCTAMFCNPKSSILVAAADKGLLAITDDDNGSIFTLTFAEQLKKTVYSPSVKNREIQWGTLLEKIKASTFRLSKTFDLPDGGPGNQKAFFVIEETGSVSY